jgi:hypothetical protein
MTVIAPRVVHGENVLAGGIVQDGVRVRAGLDRGGDFQRLDIKSDNAVVLSRGDEPQVPLGRQGHSVGPLGADFGDVADDHALVQIDHLDMGGARKVKPAGVGIDQEVVPFALATKRDGLEEFERRAFFPGCVSGETLADGHGAKAQT